MKQKHRSSQPLEINAPVRVGLVLIVLMGIAQWVDDSAQVDSLTYLDEENPIILRATGQSHAFETLGVSITPPKGWTYLSVTDDVLARQPTFVNPSGQSMLRLIPTEYIAWSETLTLSEKTYEGARVEWIEWTPRPLALTIDDDGTPLRHTWAVVDPRKIGRLSRDGESIAIMAVSHGIAPDQNPSVAEFLAAIRFVSRGSL